MANAIRALVVGTGFGCRVHVPALRAAGFEVVGLVGQNEGKLAKRAQQSGVPATFTDLDQAIGQTGAQALTIATPPGSHAELALKAIAHGCHVLCEKPFATSADEARQMLEAAERQGVVHMVAHEFRWMPDRALFGRAIADGLIGEPRFLVMDQFLPLCADPETSLPKWWFDPAQGGGWLGAGGSHLLDQIRAWLGDFDTVSGSLFLVSERQAAAEDSYSLRARMKSGVEVSMQQTAGAWGPMTTLWRCAGTKGTVWTESGKVMVADKSGLRELPVTADLELPPPPDHPGAANRPPQFELGPFTRLTESFRAQIEGREPNGPVPLPTFRDGLASVGIMDAIRASAHGGGVPPIHQRDVCIMSLPDLFELLQPLQGAIDRLDETWRPDDPAYRADVYRQTLTSLSYAYFAYFHATPEHPDWAPLWNPVYTLQPNPDDIYVQTPIRGDLTYRVSGNRGTCAILSFTSQRAASGTVDETPGPKGHNELDTNDLGIKLGEDFEIVFSAERPAGHTGHWGRIDPSATFMYLRYRSYDWLNEVDPVLSIECLDPVPPKPRLTPEEIARRIEEMAKFPARKTKLYYGMQNGVKERVGFNVFEPVRYPGALVKQTYWPACFQFEPDEALIIETDLPEKRPYWNIQLNDPYFNAVEYVYRLSSTNGHFAQVSTDGKFRAVISLVDPGVPNWLDPAGYTEGGIYGRWYDCDSEPTPSITRVKLADLRQHLPADTPVVTPEQRAEELRLRVRACQRRRRW